MFFIVTGACWDVGGSGPSGFCAGACFGDCQHVCMHVFMRHDTSVHLFFFFVVFWCVCVVGFEVACGFAWFAPPCGLWIFLSSGKTMRTAESPEGDILNPKVVQSNRLASRTCILLKLLAIVCLFGGTSFDFAHVAFPMIPPCCGALPPIEAAIAEALSLARILRRYSAKTRRAGGMTSSAVRRCSRDCQATCGELNVTTCACSMLCDYLPAGQGCMAVLHARTEVLLYPPEQMQ